LSDKQTNRHLVEITTSMEKERKRISLVCRIEDTPLRPIVSSMNTPTTGISKFLDQLIRPLFDKHVRSTTIIDGVDLIRRLETYVENDYLKATTQLCTFDITDLYIMLPQEESLDVLREFLRQHDYHNSERYSNRVLKTDLAFVS
jgi:hypothetical protein